MPNKTTQILRKDIEMILLLYNVRKENIDAIMERVEKYLAQQL